MATGGGGMRALPGKRVLMLLENAPYDADVRVPQEAQALTAAGYHVSVIAPPGQQHRWRRSAAGVQVYEYPRPPSGEGLLAYLLEYGYSMLAAFVLSFVVWAREGFDVIHAHNPPDTFVLIALFYKLFGKRFIFDHHDLSPEMYAARTPGGGSPYVYRVLLWLERLSTRVADHVIATNQSYRQVEMERDGVPPERITIVRNAPDANRLRPASPDPELRARARHLIAYVGLLGFQDGVDYMIRAVDHLVRDLNRTDFLCIITGQGAAAPELQALSKRLGLADYIWFTGYIPNRDLARVLSTVDICVDPAPSNPFTDRSTMTKVMQYMAFGKPIVVFDLPEHRVTAQGAARYVRPNDEFEFARALVELMDDPARREAMGRIGQQRLEAELDWRYSAPHLLEAYRKVMGETPEARAAAERRLSGERKENVAALGSRTRPGAVTQPAARSLRRETPDNGDEREASAPAAFGRSSGNGKNGSEEDS